MYNIISIFKKYTLTFINHIYNLEEHGGKDWTDRTQYIKIISGWQNLRWSLFFSLCFSLFYELFLSEQLLYFFFFLICSEFCHTLKWNVLEFTCLPHPDPRSHLPLHPLPPGLPRASGPSACLMHPIFLIPK